MPLVAALIVTVLAWSAVSDLVLGEGGYVLRNLVATGVLLVVARRAGFDRGALGLASHTLAAGARWGAGAVAVVLAVLSLALIAGDRLGPLAALLTDERAALPTAGLLYATLVRIPLGTVVFEEVAFRGLLDAAAHRVWPPARAVAVSAATFGLYHVPPTLVALEINHVAVASPAGIATLAGAVAVTAAAGVLFSWLRSRSGSLVAPALAHTATNVGGLLAAAASQGRLLSG